MRSLQSHYPRPRLPLLAVFHPCFNVTSMIDVDGEPTVIEISVRPGLDSPTIIPVAFDLMRYGEI